MEKKTELIINPIHSVCLAVFAAERAEHSYTCEDVALAFTIREEEGKKKHKADWISCLLEDSI